MVRYLRLKTRYASTMVAGTPPIGLLHGRQHTLPPLLPPSRIPKSTCPWTVPAVLPNYHHPPTNPIYADPPTILTYAEVLSLHRKRPPTPRRKRIKYQQLICYERGRKLPSPQHARRLRRGSWRWQSLLIVLISSSLSQLQLLPSPYSSQTTSIRSLPGYPPSVWPHQNLPTTPIPTTPTQ